MSPQIKEKRKDWQGLYGLVAVFAVVMILLGSYEKAEARQKTFKTPEEAVKGLIDAAKSNDMKKLLVIFGPMGKKIVFSGDEVADKAGIVGFIKDYEEMSRLEKETDKKMTLIVGNREWPFPVPIVKKGKTWVFDTMAGKEELLNRRIGRNELHTIQTCLAYVDAQREYAMKDGNSSGVPEYAQKFWSTIGRKDGLYWETREGEAQSPFGSVVAQAAQTGYVPTKAGEKPAPYQGYFYKILKAQGRSASGGAYDYVINDRMIGGFALIAYPAEYGASGIKTFIVNHDGVVYQKDLGKKTGKTAIAITKYDPDKTWKKVEERTIGAQ